MIRKLQNEQKDVNRGLLPQARLVGGTLPATLGTCKKCGLRKKLVSANCCDYKQTNKQTNENKKQKQTDTMVTNVVM